MWTRASATSVSRESLSSSFDAGIRNLVIAWDPGDPRPEPRKPASSGRRDPLEEDSGWQPLE